MLANSVLSFTLILMLVNVGSLQAAPTKSESRAVPKASVQTEDKESLYDQGKKFVEAKNYIGALRVLRKANAKYPNDPDILNMLAYSQRKNGRVEEAIQNYHKALRLRPRFPEAREYLGETYIQAALKEIEILKSYGPEASEELADVVEEFKATAGKL